MANDKNRTLQILRHTIGTSQTPNTSNASTAMHNVPTEKLMQLPFTANALIHLNGILNAVQYFAGVSIQELKNFELPKNISELMGYCYDLLSDRQPNTDNNLIYELNIDGGFHGQNTDPTVCNIIRLDLILRHNETTINLSLSSHPYGKGARALYDPETDDAEFILGYDPIFASRGFIVTDRLAAMAPENDDYAHLLVELTNGLAFLLHEKSDTDTSALLRTWGTAIQEIRQTDFSANTLELELPDGSEFYFLDDDVTEANHDAVKQETLRQFAMLTDKSLMH